MVQDKTRIPLRKNVDRLWPLYGYPPARKWASKDRDELQCQVGASKWLQVLHLKKMHSMMWRQLLELTVINNSTIDIPNNDRRACIFICEGSHTDESYSTFWVRATKKFPDPEEPDIPASVHVRGDFIMIKDNDEWDGPHHEEVYDILTVKYMPDCLVRHDFIGGTAHFRSLSLRELFFHASTLPTIIADRFGLEEHERPADIFMLDSRSLTCDGKVLADRIYRTLEHPSDKIRRPLRSRFSPGLFSYQVSPTACTNSSCSISPVIIQSQSITAC